MSHACQPGAACMHTQQQPSKLNTHACTAAGQQNYFAAQPQPDIHHVNAQQTKHMHHSTCTLRPPVQYPRQHVNELIRIRKAICCYIHPPTTHATHACSRNTTPCSANSTPRYMATCMHAHQPIAPCQAPEAGSLQHTHAGANHATPAASCTSTAQQPGI
jgi:hypothetical protein